MIRSLVVAVVALTVAAAPIALAQSGGDPPPSAALVVSCNGLTCTADASASVDNGPLTFAWGCGSTPNCPSAGPSIITHTYPAAGQYNLAVRVTDSIGQSSVASRNVTVVDATQTPTAAPTSTTAPTDTATPTPADTPTPAPIATETIPPIVGDLCPGQYAGLIVLENVMTMTCVKATEEPWPWQTPGTATPSP